MVVFDGCFTRTLKARRQVSWTLVPPFSHSQGRGVSPWVVLPPKSVPLQSLDVRETVPTLTGIGGPYLQ